MKAGPTLRDRLVSRLSALRQAHGAEIKRLEKQRKQFAREYSARKLARLPVEQYVIGRRELTFCYRVERELDGLGRILGAPAYKFGVFFSKSADRYLYTSIWGTSSSNAYQRLRDAIIQLLHDAGNGDIDALNASRLSPMFKGKLLHLYFPEKFAPIYSPDHLKHFVARLNLSTAGETSVERQQALMAFRSREPLLRDEPPTLMMRFLYDEYPPAETPPDNDEKTPPVSLPSALAGLKLLDKPPKAGNPSKSPSPPKPGKFDPNNGRRKAIGERGEHIVVEFERRRLRSAKRPDLAKKVTHVAETDDSQGFDILSFDDDGTPRPIEVKATTGKDLSRGFYLTENEHRVSKEKSNYHFYFVFRALSATPELLIIPRPDLSGSNYTMRPTQYHVSVK